MAETPLNADAVNITLAQEQASHEAPAAQHAPAKNLPQPVKRPAKYLNIYRFHELSIPQATRRKKRFLRMFQKAAEESRNTENSVFPNLSHLALACDVPYKTVTRWFAEDKQFLAEYEAIEDNWIEGARVNVLNASQRKGGEWIAMELLKKKRKEEFGDPQVGNILVNFDFRSPFVPQSGEVRSVEQSALAEDVSRASSAIIADSNPEVINPAQNQQK